MHLVGFIIKKFVTMHGHMNVKKKLDQVAAITIKFPRQGFNIPLAIPRYSS